MGARTEVVETLAELDLADTTRPGGIRARVEEAADLIRQDVEAAHTGRPADVIELTAVNRTVSQGAA